MRHLRLARSILPFAVVLATAVPAHALQDDPHMERGRDLTRAFYEGDLDPVVEAFTDQMHTALGGRDGLATFRDQVLGQLGTEAELLDEQVTESAGHHVYQRRVRFQNAPDPVLVTWAFDARERVAGFSIRPEEAAPTEAPSDYLEYQTKTPLRLPFNEEWTVFWGGRSVAQNYHAAHVDQRFAYDLVVVEDGGTHRGEGRTNDDYHCFGLGILAPAPGRVVEARDDLPDNRPGEMNPDVPPGNHVILDHGNGEYSFLAHLMQASARVRPGDEVETGDTLGLCGNSGNSSEPHLHYHLQDSPEFGRGAGLPAMFLDYVADGERVARGEPVQGQHVRPAGHAGHPEPARE